MGSTIRVNLTGNNDSFGARSADEIVFLGYYFLVEDRIRNVNVLRLDAGLRLGCLF
jgi:hypothetical protein